MTLIVVSPTQQHGQRAADSSRSMNVSSVTPGSCQSTNLAFVLPAYNLTSFAFASNRDLDRDQQSILWQFVEMTGFGPTWTRRAGIRTSAVRCIADRTFSDQNCRSSPDAAVGLPWQSSFLKCVTEMLTVSFVAKRLPEAQVR